MLFLQSAKPRSARRRAKKHGKAKALSILAHKLGRAAYYMLKHRQAFHLPTFLSA